MWIFKIVSMFLEWLWRSISDYTIGLLDLIACMFWAILYLPVQIYDFAREALFYIARTIVTGLDGRGEE